VIFLDIFMQIGIAQINPLVGDIEGNTQHIIDCAQRLQAQGVDLLVFPELTLTGYPPEDLLFRPACQQRVDQALEQLLHSVQGITIVVGFPGERGGQRYNMAAALRDGKVLAEYRKRELPNYSVFDERRYFVAGTETAVFTQQGIKFALAICEDIWFDQPTAEAVAAGAQWVLNLNASPFQQGKAAQREAAVTELAQRHNVNILYVNQVGGQDELVFDGASFAVNQQGQVQLRCQHFAEQEALLSLDETGEPQMGECAAWLDAEAEIYQALVCGVRDYVHKNGFHGVVLGLSGGIDSALTLAIAVDALGAGQVEVVLMPSRYTADMSNEDAIKQADTLGVEYHIIPIEPAFAALQDMLADTFAGMPQDVTEENMQARCRGLILMAISNKKNRMLLTTGNKSEMSVGYATLYGDMNGGYAPLKDVPKLWVYRLAHWRNRDAEIIPVRVIERPPSAELSADQKDSDSLPDYDILDAIIERYVEHDQSVDDIVAAGFELDTVSRITRLIDRSEYKRRQAPPGVKITQRAYGRDRRYPIVNKF
jgi:NAD+ synthase (glutamine-hydrolysing)